MALLKDIYREFEDIVGPENISQEPVVLDGYAYQGMVIKGPRPEDRYFPVPEAVLLPGCTEEVQAIVKLCNRRGVGFKAHSTGYGPHANVSDKGQIILDMRRMNRILEFDEKNMMVIVEPYVSYGQVQTEAMKRGLYVNVLGAGAQVSVLASTTSMHGNNALSITQGHSGRNLLGVEWVLPDGELIRVGAPGSDAGWFSGDGPGPSLRGILRGSGGAMGALGVFTKCAVHLHPWHGPSTLDVKGISPNYDGVIPQYIEYHMLEFTSWENLGIAIDEISQAGIAFGLQKTGGPGSHGLTTTGNNNEYWELRKAGELNMPFMSFTMAMVAASEKQNQYQVKTLNEILKVTGGRICPIGETPRWRYRDFLQVMKCCFTLRSAFRSTGAFNIDGMVGMDTTDNTARALAIDEELRDKYKATGLVFDDGLSNSWATTLEGGHFTMHECGQNFGGSDPASCEAAWAMHKEGNELSLKLPAAIGWSTSGMGNFEKVDIQGKYLCNVQDWMRLIKRTFDPNEASDPSCYISGKTI